MDGTLDTVMEYNSAVPKDEAFEISACCGEARGFLKRLMLAYRKKAIFDVLPPKQAGLLGHPRLARVYIYVVKT